MFNNPLLDHYQHLLNNLLIYTDDNAQCYTKKKGSDVQIPTIIENRRLVLPTPEILKAPNWDAQIAFHPFSESVLRGPSEIIEWMKERMLTRLTALINITAVHLTEIAASAEAQQALTTNQLSIIQQLGEADEKTLKLVEDLAGAGARGKGQMVHFFLRHSGKTGGSNSFRRYCKVTFPIYKEIMEDSDRIFEIKVRKKDKVFLTNLYDYLFDKIGLEDHYSAGSNSEVAPYYHALIEAFGKVGKTISSHIWIFRSHMKDYVDSRITPDGWLDTFEAAAKSASFLPALAFNIGKGGQGTGNDNAAANAASAKIVEEVPVLQQSNGALQAMVGTSGGSSSLLHGLLTGNVALVSQANFNTILGVQPPAMNPLQQGGSVLQNLLGVNNTVPAATSNSLGKSSLGAFGAAAAPQATPNLNSLLNGQYNRGWG